MAAIQVALLRKVPGQMPVSGNVGKDSMSAQLGTVMLEVTFGSLVAL